MFLVDFGRHKRTWLQGCQLIIGDKNLWNIISDSKLPLKGILLNIPDSSNSPLAAKMTFVHIIKESKLSKSLYKLTFVGIKEGLHKKIYIMLKKVFFLCVIFLKKDSVGDKQAGAKIKPPICET